MLWNWGMKEKLLLINTTVGVTIRGCGGAECLINNWAGSLSLYWLSVCTGQAYTGYHSVCCSHQTLHNAHCTQHNAHYTIHNAKCTLHTPTHTSDRVDCSAGQSVIKSKELNPVVALQWPPRQPSLHIDNRLLTLTWSGLVRTDGSCYFLHVWCRPEPGWLVSTFQVKAVDN